MMRRGYSRDHRPDCEQMVIALIVNSEGFPFSYETFDGNRADVSTMETILRMMIKWGRFRLAKAGGALLAVTGGDDLVKKVGGLLIESQIADFVTDQQCGLGVGEKSDTPILPRKPPNEGVDPAEAVEGRGVAKGNADKVSAPRTQSRTSRASMGLEGVRPAARRDRRLRFTALLHHITPSLLEESFYAVQHNAAAGVDGMTWREYEGVLQERVHVLHREIHTGAYRVQPSRRVCIPKADGRQRPLGIASLEDKIVQQAVVTVLSAIYEEDFLGFSYGFRRGRGQHDALDALVVGIKSRKVNWILDADSVARPRGTST